MPTRRRCCWCTAAATIAATGTGWRRSSAATGTSSPRTCRGHGDSQWSQDGTYMMAGYIYDMAQLIHQLKIAPVTILAHSLGGNIALRYAGLYPENVAKLIAIEGLGPSPRRMNERGKKPFPERMRDLDRRAARSLGAPAAALRLHRGRLEAHAGGEQAPDAGAGAPPHPARRQPERGRHLQLEVRQLRALMAALRHDLRRGGGAVGSHRLPDAAGLRQGELGIQSRQTTAARGISRKPRSFPSRVPATGCITTSSASSSP